MPGLFLPPVLKSSRGEGVSAPMPPRPGGRPGLEQLAALILRAGAPLARARKPLPNHLPRRAGRGRGRSARAPRPGRRPPARLRAVLLEPGPRGPLHVRGRTPPPARSPGWEVMKRL